MNKEYLRNTQAWVREELDRCVNFWLKNGMDKVNGGVYTCLDRTGRVYSTDKSVWMQGRCGWILPVPSVWHQARVAGSFQVLLGFHGEILHQP